MSFNVSFLSDSMWRNLDATFAIIGYKEYDSVHFVPGCQIDKMYELAEKFCTQSDLIVVNAGINNLLNGYSVAHCMRKYDRCYKAVTTECKTAHLAFASLSYVAENNYTGADNSVEMNTIIDELNCELQSYCEEHDKAYFVDLRACLCDAQSQNVIARRNLAVDGLHYSRYGIKMLPVLR